jgi:hypothetical protein
MLRSTRAASGAAAVLLALALTACGDDGGSADDDTGAQSGSPTDASVEEFCTTINDQSPYEDIDFQNPDPQELLDALQQVASNLEEVGTPEGISDDAREGFEISVEKIADLKAEDIDLQSNEDPFEAGLSEDEKAKVEAFNSYESETCTEEAPSEEGSTDLE